MNDTNSYIVVLKPFILHCCQNDRTVGNGTKGAWKLNNGTQKISKSTNDNNTYIILQMLFCEMPLVKNT